MSRKIWTAAALLAGTGAAALLLSQPHASDARTPDTVVTATPSRDVRVQHEFITIAPARPAPVIRSRPSGASLSASATRSLTVPARPPHSPSSEPALLAKVGRAVTGDGRHRPEPFPRVR
ncbi:MAG TPA: hypothetical protein VM493_03380 [Vicinamibacterales bacterium]|nr:hypothetical protein [Vicinamibacterales bacterium]